MESEIEDETDAALEKVVADSLRDLAKKLDEILARRRPQDGEAVGWRMVPVEPTPEMVAEITGRSGDFGEGGARRLYAALLSAAGSP